MERKTGLLLVEGNDDLHVFANLFREHGVRETFAIKEHGGSHNLLRSLPVHLKGSEANPLGVVIDADLDVRNRWRAVHAILSRAGFANVPATVPRDGLVLKRDDGLRFGLWIMPDNALPGQLEDFVKLLVPADDPLWPRAEQCVHSIPHDKRRFTDTLSKLSCILGSLGRKNPAFPWAAPSPGSSCGQTR